MLLLEYTRRGDSFEMSQTGDGGGDGDDRILNELCALSVRFKSNPHACLLYLFIHSFIPVCVQSCTGDVIVHLFITKRSVYKYEYNALVYY